MRLGPIAEWIDAETSCQTYCHRISRINMSVEWKWSCNPNGDEWGKAVEGNQFPIFVCAMCSAPMGNLGELHTGRRRRWLSRNRRKEEKKRERERCKGQDWMALTHNSRQITSNELNQVAVHFYNNNRFISRRQCNTCNRQWWEKLNWNSLHPHRTVNHWEMKAFNLRLAGSLCCCHTESMLSFPLSFSLILSLFRIKEFVFAIAVAAAAGTK